MWKPAFRLTTAAIACLGVFCIVGTATAKRDKEVVGVEEYQDLEVGRDYDRFIVRRGGQLILNGTTKIKDQAELIVDQDGLLDLDGTIEVESGGKLTLNHHLRKKAARRLGKVEVNVKRGGVLVFGKPKGGCATINGDLVNEGVIWTTRVGRKLGLVEGNLTSPGVICLSDRPYEIDLDNVMASAGAASGSTAQTADMRADMKTESAALVVPYIADPALFSISGAVNTTSGSVTVIINTTTGHYGRCSVAGNITLGNPALYVSLSGTAPSTLQKFDILRAYKIIGDFAAIPTTPHWRRVMVPLPNPPATYATEYDLYYQ